MASLQLTTTLLGAGLAGVIVVLVRRDHLHLSHGVFWIVVAVLAALLGMWPALLDRVAAIAGISYPPTFLLLGAIMILFVKSLYADIASTRVERQVRRLNQRLAMYEAAVQDRASTHDASKAAATDARHGPIEKVTG
ncbi:MAG TPA: DUF2304 domain-containing protein [Azoarcus taiwanensis]|nr:DUF2304 domain-containing protein [Azoarcus taiwanensis]